MNKQEFDAVAVHFASLQDKDLKKPDMPIAEFVQEGEDLAIWANQDREDLQNAGLNASLLDDLLVRTDALRYQQALWLADTESRKNALQEWKDTSPNGYDLVSVLNHNFRFAFRKHPELLARIDEIAQDAGHADMVQDLLNLSVLGKQHVDLLEAVAFDLGLLDQAAELSDNLSSLLAKNNGNKEESSEIKQTRDKAYSYLKLAIDEIRKYGKFVFWRNPDRLTGYSSKYHRN